MAAPPYVHNIFVGQRYAFFTRNGLSLIGIVIRSAATADNDWLFIIDNVYGYRDPHSESLLHSDLQRIIHLKADGTSEVIFARPAGGRRRSHRRRSHRRRSHRRWRL